MCTHQWRAVATVTRSILPDGRAIFSAQPFSKVMCGWGLHCFSCSSLASTAQTCTLFSYSSHAGLLEFTDFYSLDGSSEEITATTKLC